MCIRDRKQIVFQPIQSLFPVTNGKQRPTPHTQSQDNRSQKCHQCVGRTYRCQCVRTQILSHNERIRHVIKLLQQIPHHHRKRKPQQCPCNISLCQIYLQTMILLIFPFLPSGSRHLHLLRLTVPDRIHVIYYNTVFPVFETYFSFPDPETGLSMFPSAFIYNWKKVCYLSLIHI